MILCIFSCFYPFYGFFDKRLPNGIVKDQMIFYHFSLKKFTNDPSESKLRFYLNENKKQQKMIMNKACKNLVRYFEDGIIRIKIIESSLG